MQCVLLYSYILFALFEINYHYFYINIYQERMNKSIIFSCCKRRIAFIKKKKNCFIASRQITCYFDHNVDVGKKGVCINFSAANCLVTSCLPLIILCLGPCVTTVLNRHTLSHPLVSPKPHDSVWTRRYLVWNVYSLLVFNVIVLFFSPCTDLVFFLTKRDKCRYK